MSRKHVELERELIEDLEPRTGRSLSAWMSAIDAAGLAGKNSIIDWLRPQGLTFAHASWLERIHNNGGRPIYLDGAGTIETPQMTPCSPVQEVVGAVAQAIRAPAALLPQRSLPVAAESFARPACASPPPRPPSPSPILAYPVGGLEALLVRGKGLRPLADMLLREIRQALPDAVLAATGDLVSVAAPEELAVLAIGPRELRLGLALGEMPCDPALSRTRPAGAGAHITHTLVLKDARQLGEALLDLVRLAYSHCNSRA